MESPAVAVMYIYSTHHAARISDYIIYGEEVSREYKKNINDSLMKLNVHSLAVVNGKQNVLKITSDNSKHIPQSHVQNNRSQM
jgi:hypothetical protein